MSSQILPRLLAAGALAALVALPACSVSVSTGSDEPVAQASTGSSAPPSSIASDATTTSTAEKRSPKVESLVDSLASSTGTDFTPDEVECMEQYAADNPAVVEADPTTDPEAATVVMDLIASCVDKERFVDMMVEQIGAESQTGFTPAQRECVRAALMTLDQQDFADIMVGDTSVLTPLFAECAAP